MNQEERHGFKLCLQQTLRVRMLTDLSCVGLDMIRTPDSGDTPECASYSISLCSPVDWMCLIPFHDPNLDKFTKYCYHLDIYQLLAMITV